MTEHDRNQYILSLGAVAMSAVALIFAFLELRSSDRQLDASVWPYVDTAFSLNTDASTLSLSNKGLGPALIREFRVLHDGVEIQHPLDLPQFADVGGARYSVTTASAPGSVLSVGEDLVVYEIRGEDVGLRMQEALRGLEIEICYCSINDACWSNASGTSFREPVDSCADQSVDIEQALDIFRDTNRPIPSDDTGDGEP